MVVKNNSDEKCLVRKERGKAAPHCDMELRLLLLVTGKKEEAANVKLSSDDQFNATFLLESHSVIPGIFV